CRGSLPSTPAGVLARILGGRPMQRIDTVAAFRAALDAERSRGRVIGLVATMGALHGGHRSLVQRASGECDVVAVTVFVNPFQFDSPADLAAYPADLEADAERAAAAGADYLFAPGSAEMAPAAMATRVHVEGAAAGLEGAARPGHFDGVATIVVKLFAIAGPCRAYFGEKDFQQLAVVRQLVADLCLPVEVVACPTVRADDGLALSSRNARLSPEERRAATVLYRALRVGEARFAATAGGDVASVEAAMATVVAGEPLARLDYVAVIPEGPGGRLHVAAWIGGTRLIDNLAAGGVDG
ncbi:MAG: pantoate--beta-alanine ligase, partial [Acidimicrobiales bacterium]